MATTTRCHRWIGHYNHRFLQHQNPNCSSRSFLAALSSSTVVNTTTTTTTTTACSFLQRQLQLRHHHLSSTIQLPRRQRNNNVIRYPTTRSLSSILLLRLENLPRNHHFHWKDTVVEAFVSAARSITTTTTTASTTTTTLHAETELFLKQQQQDFKSSSSTFSNQQAAHLMEQWLLLFSSSQQDQQPPLKDKNNATTTTTAPSTARFWARKVFLRWLVEWKTTTVTVCSTTTEEDTGMMVTQRELSQYFHRLLNITVAPEAYPLYETYFKITGFPVTSQAITMVVERMLPYQWTDATIASDLEKLLLLPPPTTDPTTVTTTKKSDDDKDLAKKARQRAQNAFLWNVPWTAPRAKQYLETSIQQPDAYSYSAVIQKYIQEGDIDSACAMAKKHCCCCVAAVSPTTTIPAESNVTIGWNLCLWALAKAGRNDEVIQMFRTLKFPNEYSYTALLQAVSPEQGRNILLHQQACPLGAHAYGIVMTKYSKLIDQGETVEELLHQASQTLSTDELIVLKGIAITAWGNTNTWVAPDRATAIYRTVVDDDSTTTSSSMIHPALTTALLQVWSKSTRPDAADRCRTIFQSMVNQGHASTAAFHLMLSAQTAETAWQMLQAQAQLIGHQQPKQQPQQSHAVVDTGTWIVPIATSWATVLARPGHSIERIYEIVTHYKTCLKPKQRNDDDVFGQVIRAMPSVALAHSFVVQECRTKKNLPHRRDYSNVYRVLLKRWSRSREAVAPERAEEIARWMMMDQKEEEEEKGGKHRSAGTTTTMDEQVRQLLVDTWERSDRTVAPMRIGYLLITNQLTRPLTVGY